MCVDEADSRLRCSFMLEVVAHKIYGVPQTINSANYVYFLAYQELFALRSGVDGSTDSVKGEQGEARLIPFRELDRIVTGMWDVQGSMQHADIPLYWKRSYYHSIEVKASNCYGATRCNAPQRRNTSQW